MWLSAVDVEKRESESARGSSPSHRAQKGNPVPLRRGRFTVFMNRDDHPSREQRNFETDHTRSVKRVEGRTRLCFTANSFSYAWKTPRNEDHPRAPSMEAPFALCGTGWSRELEFVGAVQMHYRSRLTLTTEFKRGGSSSVGNRPTFLGSCRPRGGPEPSSKTTIYSGWSSLSPAYLLYSYYLATSCKVIWIKGIFEWSALSD